MESKYNIEVHRLLGPNTEFTESPNHSGEFAAGHADTIVMHYTAGANVSSSVDTLVNGQASAHLVIGRDGSIVQLVPFNTIAWHAGRSSWQGRTGLNKFSIGIELDNAGHLTSNDNGTFSSWFGRQYPTQEVFKGVHRNQQVHSYWHAYTEEQIKVTFAVCQLLCETYAIDNILGHEEIAPTRKTDPGPAFPLDRLRAILSDERRVEEGESLTTDSMTVLANKLNVRQGPGTHFGTAGSPLLKGQVLNVLKQEGAWTEVEYQVKGWVSSRYLT